MNAISPEAVRLQEMDREHHLHPFTDTDSLNAAGSRIITRGQGIYVWDEHGRKLLDGMAGLWCVNVGYGRRELIDAAVAQLNTLPYYNTFFQCSHPAATELATLVAEVTPEGMNHVFFTNSGSEANDTIIRMVRHYWACQGQPERNIIISRKNAYHGSTMGAASLGGMPDMHKQGGLPIPNIEHIEQPHWFASDRTMDPEAFGLAMAGRLEQRIEELGAERVAAFIGEPVQGAGGVIVPPDSYWPEIQRICNKYGILLVADEVICGFGRLGTWFGSDYFGIKPDLMPIAKGLSSGYIPIGGVVVRDDVADVLAHRGGEFHHGFTYSGHPVACAVAAANIRVLRKEGIPEHVRTVAAPRLQKLWHALENHPLVAQARGVGLVGGLTLALDEVRQRPGYKAGDVGKMCRDLAIENGLIMRSVKDDLIISPPLVITVDEIDDLIARARRVLDQAAARLDEKA